MKKKIVCGNFPKIQSGKRGIDYPKLVLTAAILSCLVFYPAMGKTATLLDDGDFSSWITEGSSNASATRIASSGNPGAYLSLSGGPSSLSYLMVKENTVSYNPSSKGPISTISFLSDVIGDSAETDPPTFGFALFQDGKPYAHYIDFSYSDWNSISALNLSSSDFGDNILGNPDFSSAGSSISFGVMAGNGLSSASFNYSMDNFKVSVDIVPLLSALWLLGSGLVGIVGIRRKFKK